MSSDLILTIQNKMLSVLLTAVDSEGAAHALGCASVQLSVAVSYIRVPLQWF